MRKIVICLLMSGLILITMSNVNKSLMFKEADYYSFYSGGQSSTAKIENCEAKNAREIKNSIKELSGESARYIAKNKLNSLLKEFNAKIVMTEYIENATSFYCFSDKIDSYLVIDGKKINLHIVISEIGTTVGSPIIFGGY